MNNLAANLRTLMEIHELSENKLSTETGVPQPTIHRILKGSSKEPRDSTLEPIARFFQISLERLKHHDVAGLASYALLDGRPPPVRIREPSAAVVAYAIDAVDGTDGTDPSRHAMVDVVEPELHAGDGGGNEIAFVETRYRLPFQIEWLRSVGILNPEHAKLVPVRGSSMESTLFDRDNVLINLRDTRVISDAVYAIILDGESKVKRLFVERGGVRVVSDNPDKQRYPDDFVGPEQSDRLFIVGRAVSKSGRGGL